MDDDFAKAVLLGIAAVLLLVVAIASYQAERLGWAVGAALIGGSLGLWGNVLVWRLWRRL